MAKALDRMGDASNEKREQRIIKMRVDFNHQVVMTVASAVAHYGYAESTIRKWARDGQIPLIESDGHSTVVPLTSTNTPAWLANFTH